MDLTKHCKESIVLFGEPYEEIHKWLDEFAGKPGIGMKHRKFRHHESGIQQVSKLFGGQAGMVARQHIISDLKEEGWIEGVDPFPKDEADYVKMGFF